MVDRHNPIIVACFLVIGHILWTNAEGGKSASHKQSNGFHQPEELKPIRTQYIGEHESGHDVFSPRPTEVSHKFSPKSTKVPVTFQSLTGALEDSAQRPHLIHLIASETKAASRLLFDYSSEHCEAEISKKDGIASIKVTAEKNEDKVDGDVKKPYMKEIFNTHTDIRNVAEWQLQEIKVFVPSEVNVNGIVDQMEVRFIHLKTEEPLEMTDMSIFFMVNEYMPIETNHELDGFISFLEKSNGKHVKFDDLKVAAWAPIDKKNAPSSYLMYERKQHEEHFAATTDVKLSKDQLEKVRKALHGNTAQEIVDKAYKERLVDTISAKCYLQIYVPPDSSEKAPVEESWTNKLWSTWHSN